MAFNACHATARNAKILNRTRHLLAKWLPLAAGLMRS
jgi:hypothetical protein